MKRFMILLSALAITVLTLTTSIYGEDYIETDAETQETLQYYDENGNELETLPFVVGEETTAYDYDKIVSDLYDKIQSELSVDIAERVGDLIEDWNNTDKDATLGDRIKEFFEPDNIVNTVSIVFMVVVGIAVYYLKLKQGISITNTNKDLNDLKDKLKQTQDNGAEIIGNVEELAKAVAEVSEYLNGLADRIDSREDSAEKAKEASIGAATMLNHIFQNSKTIDQAGKKIANIDYLKAIGEPIDESVVVEEVKAESEKDEV